MQMLLIRLVSVAVALSGALWLTRSAAPEFLALPSAYELKSRAGQMRFDAFSAVRQQRSVAQVNVIAPPSGHRSGDGGVEGPDPGHTVRPVGPVHAENGDMAPGSVSIPFLQPGAVPHPPPAEQGASAGFREGLQGSDIRSGREQALSELPTISIPDEERIAPTPEAPAAPPLLPAGPSQTDQIFTPMRGVRTFLLMGSDKRDHEATWRTDVIVIAVLDQRRNRVDMISVPRDLYIDNPPRHEPSKINTFDYWGEQEKPGGGPELMKQIVLSYFGIPIDHFVRLQFSGFAQIVDAMGGIDLYVPCPLYDILPEENLYLNLQPGHHTLNGDQALAYVRSREQGGDLSRVGRQQQVLIALKQKFTVRNMVPQIPSMYTTVRNAVDTDIGLLDAVALARLAYTMDFDGISVLTLRPREHFEDGWAHGMQVWLPDWERIRSDVQLLLADVPDPEKGQVGTSASEIEDQSLVAPRCQ